PDAYAFAPLGGMNIPGSVITFCQPLLNLGPLMTTAVILHECAHFVDATIRHFASELKPGGPGDGSGRPVDAPKNYAQLNAFEAQKNAYSYAQFAVHIIHDRDRRFVSFKE